MEKKTHVLGAAIFILFSIGNAVAQTPQSASDDKWIAPSSAERNVNPFKGDGSTLDGGRANYEIACMVCHGKQGKGDGPAAAALEKKPGNLSDPTLWNQTDGELFWKISQGRNPMPPFQEAYSDEQIWQIINYVRTLAKKPAGWTEKVIEQRDVVDIVDNKQNAPIASEVSHGQGPVSREEYEKLLQDVANLQRQLSQMQQGQAVSSQETAENLQTLKAQVNDVAAKAEASSSGTTKTLIAGYADAGFTDIQGEDSTFGASFNPLFHWKPNDKLLLTGELEFQLEGSETEMALEYAHMSYLANDYMTVGVGKFLTPFGTFTERLHPSWINKLPDKPLGMGHGGFTPGSSLGAQIRGGFPAGPTKFNYAFYVANGPKLNIGDASAEEDGHGEEEEEAEEAGGHGGDMGIGTLDYENYDSFGENKAFGGRYGFLPIPELELGYSWMYGRLNSEGTSRSNVDAFVQAVDLSYTRDVDKLKGIIDARAQWNWASVGDTNYGTEHDPLEFDNTSYGGYGQLAYRPTKVRYEVLRDCEFVFRWDMIDLPSGVPTELDQKRWTFGVNYWLNPSTVVKAAYQTGTQENAHGEETNRNGVLLQAAMGF